MRPLLRILVFSAVLLPLYWSASAAQTVDLDMVARIREEGLQRSQLANTFSYMTDVLGARLTNSRDMDRAQEWVISEMERIGLVNTAREPVCPAFSNYFNATEFRLAFTFRRCQPSYIRMMCGTLLLPAMR